MKALSLHLISAVTNALIDASIIHVLFQEVFLLVPITA